MGKLPKNAIDLGSNTWIVKIEDDKGNWIGIDEFHYNEKDDLCCGWVPFNGPRAWTVESLDPLTLSPSLLCPRCHHHGWIRNGSWVEA